MFWIRSFLLLFLLFPIVCFSTPERPKLMLVLVVDQFRADYLTRFEGRFLPAHSGRKIGGFRYLMDEGAYYPQAQHGLLLNMTCPGHAAILTGAYSYQSGIVLNDWYDREERKSVYCVEDASSSLVGLPSGVARDGVSPQRLIGSTVGDELKLAGFKSKVVSVSLKDRAAVLLGGHLADLALWMDDASFQWVSSHYYLPGGKLPPWVARLNQQLSSEKGRSIEWRASGSGTRSSNQEQEFLSANPELNTPLIQKIGVEFPHHARAGDIGSYFLPFGGDKTVEVAERALDGEQLGRGPDTDILAVSFSTHDFLGHNFGPNSREMEELTVAEDGNVATLLNYVNKHVPGGLKNTLVVLTADHGIAPVPEMQQAVGPRIPSGRMDVHGMETAINDKLNQKFGKPTTGAWIAKAMDLNFFLNRDAVEASHHDAAEIEKVAADTITSSATLRKGMTAIYTEAEVRARTLPPGVFETQILRSFYPGRSGDIVVIPKPFFIADKAVATHMTGYSYDRTVPLIIAGKWIRPGVYSQATQVIDLAPTLSLLTGTIPPSGAEGRVLSEALSGRFLK